MKRFNEIATKNYKKDAEEFTRNSILAITARASHNWINQVLYRCDRFKNFCDWIDGNAPWTVLSSYKELSDIAIANDLTVFDVSSNVNPIQSVLFKGIDYTCIEDFSVYNLYEFPAEHLRQMRDNCSIFSSDFEDDTHYLTNGYNGRLITSLRDYEYLINDDFDCGYRLPEEEILPILKEKYPILFMHTLNRYDKEKFVKHNISKYYDLVKLEDFYLVLVRKGFDIELEF